MKNFMSLKNKNKMKISYRCKNFINSNFCYAPDFDGYLFMSTAIITSVFSLVGGYVYSFLNREKILASIIDKVSNNEIIQNLFQISNSSNSLDLAKYLMPNNPEINLLCSQSGLDELLNEAMMEYALSGLGVGFLSGCAIYGSIYLTKYALYKRNDKMRKKEIKKVQEVKNLEEVLEK